MPKLKIKSLFHSKNQVGRNIKSTKLYNVWEFVLEDKLAKIELFNSILSGKKSLLFNGKLIYEDESFSNDFSHSFIIKLHKISIIQKNQDRFDLLIDNYNFNTLIEDESNGNFKFIEKGNNLVEDLLNKPINQNENQKKEENNFFNDTDFNFGNNNSSKPNENKSNINDLFDWK